MIQFYSVYEGGCFPGGSVVKNPPANPEDVGLIPGSEDPQGNGNPLQHSCLAHPMDRGAWQATVHGVTRVRHDLATKPPPPADVGNLISSSSAFSRSCLNIWKFSVHVLLKPQSVSSVAQSCPTLCDPMNHSTPGLPVHHLLPEFTQTHIH